MAGSLQLFWTPFVVPWHQGTLRRVGLGSSMSLARSLARYGFHGGSSSGEQVQVGNGPQERGMRFWGACATWLPGGGRSAACHPGPEPRSICSRKGLVAASSCPARVEGSSGLPAQGAGGGLWSWTKDPGLGQKAQRRGSWHFVKPKHLCRKVLSLWGPEINIKCLAVPPSHRACEN